VQREAELLARFGFSHQVLRGDEVRQFEPAVVGNVAGAVFFPESGQCNPHRYSVVMAQAAEGLGARLLVETEVTDLRTEGDRVVSVTTSRGAIDADAVVLATGAWAPKLARRVGLRLPVQPGKGYHLDFDRTDRSPLRPVVAVQEKVFITPFDDILRLGGTMELSGFNFEPISERLDMLARGAAKYLEGIERREARSEWCHLRPMTPDGLPIIGPAPAFANVWVATGHGMLGITQGPSTGYLLAEAIATGDASVDLSEVRPNRKY